MTWPGNRIRRVGCPGMDGEHGEDDLDVVREALSNGYEAKAKSGRTS